jgi:hypothetical protein
MNDFVKHIYCINLDRRSDRWEESLKEFDKRSLSVSKFPGIDGIFIALKSKMGPVMGI